MPTNNNMQINAITHYQTQAGTPRTKPLGSCNIAIGFRPGILLTSTLQVKQIRDQTRLRTPNDLSSKITPSSCSITQRSFPNAQLLQHFKG